MTALNFAIRPDMVVIATDTLVSKVEKVTGNRVPAYFTSKTYSIPHLRTVICGTGLLNFIAEWALHVQTRMLLADITNLHHHTPDGLRSLWLPYADNTGLTSTIYQFGFDPEMGRFRGFVYRSKHQFNSEEFSPSANAMKPQVANFSDFLLNGDEEPAELASYFVRLITQQRTEDNQLAANKRVGIGGEVQITVLEPASIKIYNFYRFDDYDSLLEEMFQGFSQ